jgi:predicted metal-dependent hydrolase
MSWLRATDPTQSEQSRSLVLRNGESIPVRWVHDARARRLRLIVNERGVRLTVPRSASIRLAETFLFEHRDWVQAQLANRPAIDTRPFAREHDQHLFLRSQRLPIEWREGRYARVELGEHGVLVTQPASGSDKHLRSALKDFYLQQARSDLGAWLPKYLPTLPRAPIAFKLRPLSSLWGSLSVNETLMLDLSLVLGRPSAYEYVLVHELCHLLQRNHSRRFWREVEARWPDWRQERDYLHGDGLAIKAELRRMVAA